MNEVNLDVNTLNTISYTGAQEACKSWGGGGGGGW